MYMRSVDDMYMRSVDVHVYEYVFMCIVASMCKGRCLQHVHAYVDVCVHANICIYTQIFIYIYTYMNSHPGVDRIPGFSKTEKVIFQTHR